MPTPTERACLNQVKIALISQYGSVRAACAELGVSRWGIRHAALGRAPGILKKMEDAGIFDAPAGAETPAPTGITSNSLGGHGFQSVVIAAANARALTGDEMEQLCPYGEFPNPAGIQRVNRVVAQGLVSALNSLRAKQGAAFRGLPIYRGHPDVDPRNYPDDRRFGKILSLEARDDALYAQVSWNNLGEENKREAYWVYPSPVWKYKRIGGGIIEPTEVVSVGLTNVPTIKSIRPWAQNSLARNSLVKATTPGAAKREAKQLMKEHVSRVDGYTALTKIAQRQDHLRREKGLGEHEALLQAQIDLPVSAAAAAAHMERLDEVKQAQDRKENLKDFAAAVRARMDRQRLSHTEAWTREKRERKATGKWTPDSTDSND